MSTDPECTVGALNAGIEDVKWPAPNAACEWARFRLYYEPPVWRHMRLRTPARVGRLRAGQVARYCNWRFLDRFARHDFTPLNWLSPRTSVARDAAAIIRRAR